MPLSLRDARAVLICTMFALAPIAPASALAGMSWRAGGPRIVEAQPEEPGAREARLARLTLAEQVGWQAHASAVPCPTYSAEATCTRVTLTTASGAPVEGMLGMLEVGFAADGEASAPRALVEREPGVYLSAAAPDRPGLWDLRLVLGARDDAPAAFEIVERVAF
jgi:hypothetical protein